MVKLRYGKTNPSCPTNEMVILEIKVFVCQTECNYFMGKKMNFYFIQTLNDICIICIIYFILVPMLGSL